METTLSTKGQIVLPQRARQKLSLTPGAKLGCRVTNGSIVLTPKAPARGQPKLVRDRATGLMITRGPVQAAKVSSDQVRAVLTDFP